MGRAHRSMGGRRTVRAVVAIGRALTLGIASATACRTMPAPLRCVTPSAPSSGASPAPYVEVRFLGAGGFLIKRPRAEASGGADVVLTAPLFSNPGLVDVGLGHIAADPKRIARGLRKYAGTRDLDVDAILVGHAHYDHLMDVPQVWEWAGSPKPTVYGNDAACHILARSAVPAGAVMSLEAAAVAFDDPSPDAGWRWLVPDYVRVLSIRSEHSPQFFHWKLHETGSYASPPPRLPTTACDWRPGQVLAYLIDLMDGHGRVEFRIHYVDSPSHETCGLVPRNLDGGPAGDRRAVDLAILNGGGAQSYSSYPVGVLTNTCASDALVGHWESFFGEHGTALPSMLSGADRVAKEARAKLGDDHACVPGLGYVMYYSIPAWPRSCPRETSDPSPCPCVCRGVGEPSSLPATPCPCPLPPSPPTPSAVAPTPPPRAERPWPSGSDLSRDRLPPV